jgi:hypothetical protein
MRASKIISGSWAFLICLMLTPDVWGQVTTGSIQGHVRDEQGAIIPGATVTTRNVETGVARTLTTDHEGRYVAPNLNLGTYEVRVELPGFQTAVRTGIALTVGAVVVVDFTLTIGELNDEVIVTGLAPLVETTQSSVGALVSGTQIADLPLNVRSYTELATLQEGVIQFKSLGGTSTGYGQQISFAGSRPDGNAYLLDGADVNNVYNKVPAGTSGGVLGVEAVREFQVITNTYSAQYGKGMGGQLNAVTKTGTNQIHGSAYEFHRNDSMDAPNYFDEEKPDFSRNQFGFSLGGPILRDKTFFFGNYEGFRQRLGLTERTTTLDENARRGILPNRAPIQVHPATARYIANLDLVPLPNGENLGDGTAEYIYSVTEPTDEHYFLLRGDHHFSGTDSFFARYAQTESEVLQAGRPIGRNQFEAPSKFTTLQQTHIFSPRWLTTVRFSYNRSANFVTNPVLVDIPQELWLNDLAPQLFGDIQPFGTIGVTGVGVPGGVDRFSPRFLTLNLYELANDYTFTSGSHSLKFGTLLNFIRFDVRGVLELRGSYTFSSLPNFLLGVPADFRSQMPGADGDRRVRQMVVGFYVQDDYQAASRLTLNLGLRYEFYTVPTEADDKLANLYNLTDPEVHVGDPYFNNPSLKNFAPRIGFAWDVRGNGKTSLRGGYGLFYDKIIYNAYGLPIFRNPPFMNQAFVRNPSWPTAYQDIVSGSVRPELNLQTIDGDPKNPFMQQWNLTYEQELFPQTSLRVGYVGSRGHNLGRLIDNVAISVDTPEGRFIPLENRNRRRNANFGEIRQRAFDASSNYHAMTVSLRRRLSQGLQAQVSYTLSDTKDDASFFIGQGETFSSSQWGLIPEDASFDRGYASFHARQNFVFNATYELPFGPGRPFGDDWTGAKEKLLAGWGFNTILKLQDGTPVTAELGFNRTGDGRAGSGQGLRPDLVPGRSDNPVLGGPDRYFDPTAFAIPAAGFYGNLARNSIIGPGLINLDFSLMKNTPVPALNDGMIQFRLEIFNLLDRANFGDPNRTVFNSAGNIVGNAARITATSTTARQIQLGVKVIF